MESPIRVPAYLICQSIYRSFRHGKQFPGKESGSPAKNTFGTAPAKAGCLYTSDVPRIAVWIVLAAAPGGCLTAAQAGDFVDSRVCTPCHTTAARNYRETGMGRSFFRPTAANTVEDYGGRNEFRHALSDTHYSMTVRDGVYYQRRWTPGFDGKPSNMEELRIDYVIGSGNHSRSYLHRTA